MASFAERFKQLRENQKNWTQEQAAEAIGVSRPTIAGYESVEKSRVPREDTLRKIADLFDVTIDYLLGHTDQNKVEVDLSSSTVGRAFFGGADQYTEDELEIARAAAQAAVEAYRKGLNKKK